MSCDGCHRRELLIGLGAGLALVGVGCGDGSEDIPVDANTGTACGAGMVCLDLGLPGNAALGTVGGSVRVAIPGDTLIVVRTETTSVAALSSICTHAKCSVRFDGPTNLLVCPCHGSRFTLAGSVNLGPATRPLKTYVATLNAAHTMVTITVA